MATTIVRAAGVTGASSGSTGTAGIPTTLIDAKGDLIGASAPDTPARVATGTVDGQILTRDSTATAGVAWTGGGAPPRHAIASSGAALTLDAADASGYVKLVTLTANCTVTLAGAITGRTSYIELVITQDGTGSRTLTFSGTTPVKWDGGQPALATAAGAITRWALTNYGDGRGWFGDPIGKNYA